MSPNPSELIADVEREIEKSRVLIAERRALIATMERDKHDGAGEAKALLIGLEQTQDLHEVYHQKLQIRALCEHGSRRGEWPSSRRLGANSRYT